MTSKPQRTPRLLKRSRYAAACDDDCEREQCCDTSTATSTSIMEQLCFGPSFTLQLQHQIGGSCARRVGEERIVLFRSDKPGAIAKVIFSSEPPTGASCGDRMPTGCDRMIAARIHLLHVQQDYRGYDLGGLLFTEAMACLSRRYFERPTDSDDSCSRSKAKLAIYCELDVEEDLRRHNKLVCFYETLGCSLKSATKVQYLHHNDGVTYRKVPMQFLLVPPSPTPLQDEYMLKHQLEFLSIRFLGSNGERICFPSVGKARAAWILVDAGDGQVMFRSTRGGYLHVTAEVCEGSLCTFVSAGVAVDPCSRFRLIAISGDDDADHVDIATEKLWMIVSCHGSFFLIYSCDFSSIALSDKPMYWKLHSEEPFGLMQVKDLSPRRRYYTTTCMRQTVSFVAMMRKRYMSFNRGAIDIRQSLKLASSLPAYPFETHANTKLHYQPLRALCYYSAETFRAIGYPDWMQLTALIHGLGQVTKVMDVTGLNAAEMEYDWTILDRSHIVGCRPRDSLSTQQLLLLNPDFQDPCYDSPTGMYAHHCGLGSVSLAWAGTEYMYEMLKHNNVLIPDEGLCMIRYASLSDWHTHGGYDALTNEYDAQQHVLVAEYAEVLRRAKVLCRDAPELSDEECERLWEEHYFAIAAKYDLDRELAW